MVENYYNFKWVESGDFKPQDWIKTKKSTFIGWTFVNCFNLAIDEIVLYVNSKASPDPKFIKWTVETNAYYGVLKDNEYDIIKLQTSDDENFHEFITLKLEIDPSKVNALEPQILIKIKFKPDCKNLRATKKVEWLPETNTNVKMGIRNDLSYLDRIFKKQSDVLPKFHFIVAIDETAQFSQGPSGSIQSKLREAVNKLIKQLLRKMKKHELESFGLVVVRFGGSNIAYEKLDMLPSEAGPFGTQNDHEGKSVYEFAPFPDAKRVSYPTDNFVDYTDRMLRRGDPTALTPKPQESFKPGDTTPLLSGSDVDKKTVEIARTEESTNASSETTKDTSQKQESVLDFLQARNIIHRLYDQNNYPDMLDLFVSLFYINPCGVSVGHMAD